MTPLSVCSCVCLIPYNPVPTPAPPSDADDAMVRPIPKCKRILGEANMLPHVVQLLLTFDPQIVEKVVQLLNLIVEVGREGGGRKGRGGGEGGGGRGGRLVSE